MPLSRDKIKTAKTSDLNDNGEYCVFELKHTHHFRYLFAHKPLYKLAKSETYQCRHVKKSLEQRKIIPSKKKIATWLVLYLFTI